jgi:hypothetical protein
MPPQTALSGAHLTGTEKLFNGSGRNEWNIAEV